MGQLADALKTLVEVLCEASGQYRFELFWDIGPPLAQRRPRPLENRRRQESDRRRFEGRMAGEKLVEHASERPDVRPSVEIGRSANLLGGHVDGRTRQLHRLDAR